MQERQRLLSALKEQLKRHGLTYRDVAPRLGLSEASVKRLFSTGRISLDRLIQVCTLLGLTLEELAREAAATPGLAALTQAQETELASDPRLLLVAVCVLNHWTPQEIVTVYQVSEAECLQRLLRLDRMGLIDLLPGDRVRIKVARDFHWRPDGPIRRLFREQGQEDFLSGDFRGEGESFAFLSGMLTAGAREQVQAQLRRLRQTFDDLHRDSLTVPAQPRHGMALLLALREWEPQAFARLRRSP